MFSVGVCPTSGELTEQSGQSLSASGHLGASVLCARLLAQRYHCCMYLKPPAPSAPSVRPEPSEWKAGAPGHLGSQRWPCCICPLSVSLDLTRKAWLLN